MTMAVVPRRDRFSVDEYERLAEIGVPASGDRVELLDGEIVEMTPIGTRHASVVARLTSLFSQRLGERVIVWGQNPIQLRSVRSSPSLTWCSFSPSPRAAAAPGWPRARRSPRGPSAARPRASPR